jgi:hypothetical protein
MATYHAFLNEFLHHTPPPPPPRRTAVINAIGIMKIQNKALPRKTQLKAPRKTSPEKSPMISKGRHIPLEQYGHAIHNPSLNKIKCILRVLHYRGWYAVESVRDGVGVLSKLEAVHGKAKPFEIGKTSLGNALKIMKIKMWEASNDEILREIKSLWRGVSV